MPTSIRIMNWNIQTFGVTKAGIKYNNYDVIEAIAKIVNDSDCDIFVMLEMATIHEETATRLAEDMLAELFLGAKNDNEWDIAVLSPNTGREFYAFFIRDRNLTIPLPITNPLNPLTAQPVRTLDHINRIENAVFTAPVPFDTGVVQGWFPLLEPDMLRSVYNLRHPKYAVWPGVRRPVLGMFYLPQAAPANAILPIVACHYVPDSNTAQQQFEALPYFSILRGLTPGSVAPGAPVQPPVRTNINRGGQQQQHTINHWTLTGDFNAQYFPFSAAYSAITGTGLNELAASAQIRMETLLVTYGEYSPRVEHTTSDLAVRAYDNFFERVAPNVPTPLTTSGPTVINVPEMVRTRAVTLNESIRHYAVLDQRGFSDGNPYLDIVQNFARQIAGDRSHMINVPGSLLGGRLISDHLPTIIDINVA